MQTDRIAPVFAGIAKARIGGTNQRPARHPAVVPFWYIGNGYGVDILSTADFPENQLDRWGVVARLKWPCGIDNRHRIDSFRYATTCTLSQCGGFEYIAMKSHRLVPFELVDCHLAQLRHPSLGYEKRREIVFLSETENLYFLLAPMDEVIFTIGDNPRLIAVSITLIVELLHRMSPYVLVAPLHN